MAAHNAVFAAETAEDCKKSADDQARLACYDRVLGYQKAAPQEAKSQAAVTPVPAAKSASVSAAAPASNPFNLVTLLTPARTGAAEDPSIPCFLQTANTAGVSYNEPDGTYSLYQQWDLDSRDRGITQLMAYRPNYAIFRHADGANIAPTSPADGRSVITPESYQFTELKFQLSFKSELVSPRCFERLVGSDRWRFWFAYTQQSNWQLFNSATSRPFRNSNYEPEAIVTVRTSAEGDSIAKPRLLNLAFVHQSNGQAQPKSRSWNRIYLQAGWQFSPEWSLMARSWYRLRDSDDDNPDIQSYLGRSDAVLRWGKGRNTVQLLARNTFNAKHNREFLQLDYSFDLPGMGPNFHIQATSGYGESLIDYNFRQKTIGLGLSFDRW